MKRFVILFFSLIMVSSLFSQDFISTFLGKCEDGENKLEVVTIGEKMLELLSSMNDQGKDFVEVIKGIESIRIVSSEDETFNKRYYETAYQLLTEELKGFEELISVQNDHDEHLVIMVKESRGFIRELVMLTKNDHKQQFNMIALNGKINLKKLVKYSKDLNISGLEKLDTVNSEK